MAGLVRHYEDKTVALNTATGTTEAIGVAGFAAGSIAVPSGSSITSLTFHGCNTATGTYVPIFEEDPTSRLVPAACTRTVAGDRAPPIPAACFLFKFIKIVTNASGNVVVTLVG